MTRLRTNFMKTFKFISSARLYYRDVLLMHVFLLFILTPFACNSFIDCNFSDFSSFFSSFCVILRLLVIPSDSSILFFLSLQVSTC